MAKRVTRRKRKTSPVRAVRTASTSVRTFLLAVPLLVIAAPAVAAQEETGEAVPASWIHVRVDEADGAKVVLNLPMTMMDVALETALRDGFHGRDLDLGADGEFRIGELRSMWRALRDAGDAEFLNVRDGDEHVRVYREGETVYVRVTEAGVETVRADLPDTVVDALLSGEGERLEVAAAVRELARGGARDVVTIRQEDSSVRIWVDHEPAGGGPR